MRAAIISAIVFCVGLIGVGVYLAMNTGGSGNRTVALDQQYLDRETQGGWVKGAAEPVVVVEEYADFQCPGCAAMQPVIDNALAQTSDYVQLIFRHYPLPQHNKAKLAAQIAEAAGRQGFFWEVENYLYSTQKNWEGSTVTTFKSQLSTFIESLGLDMDQYNADLKDRNLNTPIDADVAKGDALPVTQTPTLIINGQNIQNLPTTSAEMVALFESARTAAQ